MKAFILSVLLFSTSALAQQTYVITNVPGDFDVKIIAPACNANGDAETSDVMLFRKGQSKAFQKLKTIKGCAEESGAPETVPYDSEDQTSFFVGDYNFDGTTDLAIYGGNEGGYGSPVYKIYLFAKPANKFVYNDSLTKLTYSLGMFKVDSRNKMLYVYSKDGCCFHQTKGYRVVNNRPSKVYEFTEEESPSGATIVSAKKLIAGKWRTWNRNSATIIAFDKGKTSKNLTVRLTAGEPIKWFKIRASKGQTLRVSADSPDMNVQVVDFKGDVGLYESNERVKETEEFPVKLNGNGEYFIQVSSEKTVSVNLTISIE